MMRTPFLQIEAALSKELKTNRPDHTLETIPKLPTPDLCTLTRQDQAVAYSTHYFDGFYKKKLLYEFHVNQNYSSWLGNSMVEWRTIREQQVKLFEIIKSTSSSLNSDACLQNLQHYLSLVRKNLTHGEFFSYCGAEIVDVDDKTLDFFENALFSELKHLKDQLFIFICHNFYLSAQTDKSISQALYQDAFSILDTLRYSTVLSSLKLIAPLFIQSDYLRALGTAYGTGYASTPKFIPVYLQQILGDQLQQTINLLDGEYGERIKDSFMMGVNSAIFDIHYNYLEIAMGSKDFKSFPSLFEKVIDTMQLLLDGFFENRDINQQYMEINLDTKKTVLVKIETEAEQLAELQMRYKAAATRIKSLSGVSCAFIDGNKELKIRLLQQQLDLANIKTQLDAMEAEFKKNTSDKHTVKRSVKSSQQKPATRVLQAPSDVTLPPLESNPLKPVPVAPFIDAHAAPTPRITVDEQKKDKEHKTQQYVTGLQANNLFAKTNDSSVEMKDEYSFQFPLFNKPIKASLDHDACRKVMGDLLFEATLPKLHAVMQRARINKYGQGIKLISQSEKIAAGLCLDSLYFKIKLKGVQGDNLRVYGQVINQNGRQEVTFDSPLIGKVHKKLQRGVTLKNKPVMDSRRSPQNN